MRQFVTSVAALALMAGCGNIGVKANADPETIDRALAFLSLAETGTGRLSYAEKTVENGSVVFRQVALSGQENIKIGTLTLDGLDMSGSTATFDGIVLNDMQLVQVGENGADVGMSIERLELDKPSIDLIGWFSGWLGGNNDGLPSMDSLVADEYILEGMKFEVRADEVLMMGAIDMFRGRGLDGVRFDDITIEGLSVSGNMDVEGDSTDFEMSVSGFDLNGWNAHFLNAWDGGLKNMMAAIYKNPLDPVYDSMKIDNIRMSFGGLLLASPGLGIMVDRNAAGKMIRQTTKPYTITIRDNPDSGHDMAKAFREWLDQVGYETFSFNISGMVDYDLDRDIVSFRERENYIELEDGFRFSMGGKLEGYLAFTSGVADMIGEGESLDEDVVSEASMEAFSRFTLHNMKLLFRDDGLTDRIIAAVAKKQETEPEIIRTQMMGGIALIPMMFSSDSNIKIDKTLINDMVMALTKFVSGEGTLVISFDPPKPVSVADFEGVKDEDWESGMKILGFGIKTVDAPGK